MAFGSKWRKHDDRVGDTKRARRPEYIRSCGRAGNSARTSPTSDTHENNRRMPSRMKEARRQHGGDDQEQIQFGYRIPDLDHALEDEVGPATEITLQAARGDADDGRKRSSA